MIVPMKHITLLAIASEREQTLERLRGLGLLHVSITAADAPRVRDAQRACADTEQAITLVHRAAKHPRAHLPPRHFDVPQSVDDILAVGRELADLEAERELLEREEHRYAPFGEFEPASIRALADSGVPVLLFRVPTKRLPLKFDAPVALLGTSGVETFGAAFGTNTLPAGCIPVELPARSLAETRALLDDTHLNIVTQNAALAAAKPLLTQLANTLVERKDNAAFAAAWESMGLHGPVDSIQGFLPANDLPQLQSAAAQNGWGLATRDPLPGDNVPTLLRPPKLFRPITSLFNALGISPAYNESDVSIPFYIFFTLFFAMIVGDAGYGALFLIATLIARWKIKAMPSAFFKLFLVFNIATILWGVATATYFGISETALPAPLLHPLAKWLGDQNNIMLLCFIIGTVHLSIGRLWNAILLFPDKKCLAQLGWTGLLWSIFLIISGIVIQGFVMPAFTLWLLIASLLFVLFFTLGKGELKTNGIELGMLPINAFSAMGDIISYLRLFAIGMASVKLAANFNLMATGISLPLYCKIPAMILILGLGHCMNLAMGALSVLVHAVRLNTLEFSNAKGISWAGFAYRPFKKSTPPSPSPAEARAD